MNMRYAALLCTVLMLLAGCTTDRPEMPAGQVAASTVTVTSTQPDPSSVTTIDSSPPTTINLAAEELTPPATTANVTIPGDPQGVALAFASNYYSLGLGETAESRSKRMTTLGTAAVAKRIAEERLTGWGDTVMKAEPGVVINHDSDWFEVRVWVTFENGVGMVVPPGGAGRVIDVQIANGQVVDYTAGSSSR